jgi:hypothetical protein
MKAVSIKLESGTRIYMDPKQLQKEIKEGSLIQKPDGSYKRSQSNMEEKLEDSK